MSNIINLADWRREREKRDAKRLSLHTPSYYDLIRRLAVENTYGRTDCGDISTWQWEH